MEEQTSPFAHRGHFEIDRETLEQNIDAVASVMQGVIVIRCEYLFGRQVFYYEAISPEFEAVPEGEEAPTYEAELNEDGNGGYTVTWAKAG